MVDLSDNVAAPCPYCNTEVETISYQSRAADEPAKQISVCRCPVKVDRMSDKSRPQSPHVYLTRSIRGKRRLPCVEIGKVEITYAVTYEIKGLSSLPVASDEASCVSWVSKKSNQVFKTYVTGPLRGRSVCEIERKLVGPGMNLVTMAETTTKAPEGRVQVDFVFGTMRGGFLRGAANKVEFVVELPDPSPRSLDAAIHKAFRVCGQPRTLKHYLGERVITEMMNLSARAWDASRADPSLYTYGVKPDGERYWMTKIGRVWLLSRRLKNHEVKMWTMEYSQWEGPAVGPVVDVEVMLTGGPVPIDVLMDEHGTVSSIRRDINWIVSKTSHLSSMFQALACARQRTFRGEMSLAEQDRKSVGYPTDGVVAIRRDGVDMLKMKSEKSVELQVSEDMTLVTAEGVRFSGAKLSHFPVGSIVEVRFSVSDGKIGVSECFIRPDKTKANSTDAVRATIHSCFGSESSIVRTMMWRWSNSLREKIYAHAMKVGIPNGTVIVDVGTGSGQSTDEMKKLKGVSFVLIEPDEDKCKDLARRLNVKCHTLPRAITSKLKRLKDGGEFLVVNCKLEDVLADGPTMKSVKFLAKAFVACFSLHHIAGIIDTIAGTEIPLVGCFYSYDNIRPGQSIIDYGGIKMHRTTESKAEVKWGSDTPYEEPVVTSDDIPDDLIDGTDIEPLPSGCRSEVRGALSSVKVLM